MSILKQSAIRHLSYEELDAMLRSLAEQIRASGPIEGIKAIGEDIIPGAMLASFLNVPFGMPNGAGVGFSIYSDRGEKICLFKINYQSDHYNRLVKFHVDELQAEEDNSYQRITLPWQK